MMPLHLELPPLRLSDWRKKFVILCVMTILVVPVIAGAWRLSTFVVQ